MRNLIIILSCLLLTLSCSKFSEGPKLSLRTVKNRVSGNWEVLSYTVSGEDSLSVLTYSQITIDKFKTRELSTGNGSTSAKFNLADILTYPDGVNIGSIMLRDRNKLEFFDAIEKDQEPKFYSDTSYCAKYFVYDITNWLGSSNNIASNDFQLIRLKNNNMKLKSIKEAKFDIEYEFTKIK